MGKPRSGRGPFSMDRWLKDKRARQYRMLDMPTSPRAIVPGSITAMPAKQHDPETARLIAEWDAKNNGGPSQ